MFNNSITVFANALKKRIFSFPLLSLIFLKKKTFRHTPFILKINNDLIYPFYHRKIKTRNVIEKQNHIESATIKKNAYIGISFYLFHSRFWCLLVSCIQFLRVNLLLYIPSMSQIFIFISFYSFYQKKKKKYNFYVYCWYFISHSDWTWMKIIAVKYIISFVQLNYSINTPFLFISPPFYPIFFLSFSFCCSFTQVFA